MAWWARIACDIARNPKVRRAGPDAREVFVQLLLINWEHDFDGVIPSHYSDAEYLAGELERRPARVRAAIERALKPLPDGTPGIVQRSDCGGLLITGWSDEWRGEATPGQERTAKHRAAAKKARLAAAAARSDADGQRPTTDGSRPDTSDERPTAATSEPNAPAGVQSVAPSNENATTPVTPCNGVTTPDKTRSDQSRPEVEIGSAGSRASIAKGSQASLLSVPPVGQFDLLAVYQRYPRRDGKTEGLKRLQTQIATQADYVALVAAVEAYRLSVSGQERKFIKHFKTFAGCWRDYLEPEHEAPAVPAVDYKRGSVAAFPHDDFGRPENDDKQPSWAKGDAS